MAHVLVRFRSWFASSPLSTVPVDARVETMCTPGAVMSGWYSLSPDTPRDEKSASHAVRVQRVLIRPVVARSEHHGDAMVVHRLRRLVDRILGIESAARPPGVVHDLDVVRLLVVEDVIESRERPEDEQDVPRAETHELRP